MSTPKPRSITITTVMSHCFAAYQFCMNRRMKVLLFCVLLVAGVVAAENTTAKVPRTRDGHPDLRGNWSYATLTTLERPKEFGNKAFLTAAEAAELEKEILTVQNRDRRDGASRARAKSIRRAVPSGPPSSAVD